MFSAAQFADTRKRQWGTALLSRVSKYNVQVLGINNASTECFCSSKASKVKGTHISILARNSADARKVLIGVVVGSSTHDTDLVGDRVCRCADRRGPLRARHPRVKVGVPAHIDHQRLKNLKGAEF